MWQWLSGMSWLQVVMALRNFIRYAIVFMKWVRRKVIRAQQKKELKEIEKIEQQIDQANKEPNDEVRLNEKADAACKLEQALDPTRKC